MLKISPVPSCFVSYSFCWSTRSFLLLTSYGTFPCWFVLFLAIAFPFVPHRVNSPEEIWTSASASLSKLRFTFFISLSLPLTADGFHLDLPATSLPLPFPPLSFLRLDIWCVITFPKENYTNSMSLPEGLSEESKRKWSLMHRLPFPFGQLQCCPSSPFTFPPLYTFNKKRGDPLAAICQLVTLFLFYLAAVPVVVVLFVSMLNSLCSVSGNHTIRCVFMDGARNS